MGELHPRIQGRAYHAVEPRPGSGLWLHSSFRCALRRSALPGAVIAEIAVLRSNLWWPIILGLAAIVAVGYGLVAQVARAYLRLDAGLNRLRDVVLLLVSGVGGAALVAVVICLLLLADQELDLTDVLVAAGPLLIGDIIGIAVITPLALRLALRPQPLLDHISLRMLTEFLFFVAVVIATLWVIAAEPNGSKLF